MGNCNDAMRFHDFDHLLLYLSKHNIKEFKNKMNEMRVPLVERPEKMSLYHFLILYSVHMNNSLSKKFCNVFELNKNKLPGLNKRIRGPKYVVSYVKNETFTYIFSDELKRNIYENEAYYIYDGITILQFALVLKQSLWDRYKISYVGLDNVINLFLTFSIDGLLIYNMPSYDPDLEEKLLTRRRGTIYLDIKSVPELITKKDSVGDLPNKSSVIMPSESVIDGYTRDDSIPSFITENKSLAMSELYLTSYTDLQKIELENKSNTYLDMPKLEKANSPVSKQDE